jgi:hypothetical protein
MRVHKTTTVTSPGVQVQHPPGSFNHLVGYIKNRYKRPGQQATQIATSLTQASEKFGIDKYTLKPRANNAGNLGLMQIHASVNGKAIGKEHVKNIHNVHSNIMVGTRLLRECLDSEAHGNMSSALSLYNRGCSADKHVQRKIRAGHAYAKRVLKESQLARRYTNPLS